MIEKLDKDCGKLQKKINELVDAVNGLQLAKDAMFYAIRDIQNAPKNATISKMEKVEPTDPYAEQRKWIGKICKFWNWDTGLAHYSKLITIKDINDGEMPNCPFRADDGGWYMYCEPVKPDDDIIYKGE